MNNQPKRLESEQIPNDGGWHWDRLVSEANDRLGKIGKHGKRAKIKVIPKPGKPISVQFSLPGKGQNSYGLDLPLSRNNLVEAEEYCQLITTQLVAGTFTEDWFYSLIGKDKKVSEEEKPLTCGEMLEQYKAHYFKQRKNDKTPNNCWNTSYRYIEQALLKHKNNLISLKILREIIDKTENNSSARTYHLNGLANLLGYFDNNEFRQIIKRYKAENKPKRRIKHIPDDTEIMLVYQTGFEIPSKCAKKWRYRYAQWQFLYSLLAIYGLRVHEAWNIKNWDTPVILRDGDWIAIADDTEDTDDENEEGKHIYEQYRGKTSVIPAIIAPENKDYLLCIGHETKTGYRVAFPMSPSGHSRHCKWIKEFNLLQPLNLPNIPNPLRRIGKNQEGGIICTTSTTQWFHKKKYGFTAHALRHAYNIRGHKLGVNQKILADSLGHGLQMNSSTYLRHEQTESKIQGFKYAINEDTYKLSELERLKARNEYLEAETEKLRTKLAMYEAIKDKT